MHVCSLHFRYDFENNKIRNTNNFPTLEVDGTFDIDGKIFGTPIKANGPFKISMGQHFIIPIHTSTDHQLIVNFSAYFVPENVDYTYDMEYEIVDKNGVNYLKNLVHSLKLEPQTVKVNFENLFDDAEKCKKNFLRFPFALLTTRFSAGQFNQKINEDKERCIKEIVPSVAQILDDYVYKDLFENFLHKVPLNQIFLPD